MRCCDNLNKRKRHSATSDCSVALSKLASQGNLAIPAIVRIDLRESCILYTPPNLPSEYAGLIVGDKSAGSGFCYLALIKEECHTEIQDRLGRYPTF